MASLPPRIRRPADAIQAARDAGKSMREIFQAGRDAVKLTDEQQAKMKEAIKENEAVMKEARDKVMGVLTDEHKAKAKKRLEQIESRRKMKAAD